VEAERPCHHGLRAKGAFGGTVKLTCRCPPTSWETDVIQVAATPPTVTETGEEARAPGSDRHRPGGDGGDTSPAPVT